MKAPCGPHLPQPFQRFDEGIYYYPHFTEEGTVVQRGQVLAKLMLLFSITKVIKPLTCLSDFKAVMFADHKVAFHKKGKER